MGIRRSSTKDALLVWFVTCLLPRDSGGAHRQAERARRFLPDAASGRWPRAHRNE
jgi:hypothetical protein